MGTCTTLILCLNPLASIFHKRNKKDCLVYFKSRYFSPNKMANLNLNENLNIGKSQYKFKLTGDTNS